MFFNIMRDVENPRVVGFFFVAGVLSALGDGVMEDGAVRTVFGPGASLGDPGDYFPRIFDFMDGAIDIGNGLNGRRGFQKQALCLGIMKHPLEGNVGESRFDMAIITCGVTAADVGMVAAEPDLAHGLAGCRYRVPQHGSKVFSAFINGKGMTGVIHAGVQAEIVETMLPGGRLGLSPYCLFFRAVPARQRCRSSPER